MEINRRPDLVLINKKRMSKQVDITISADHCVKIFKKPEKINKYMDLARELKKLWNMKMTVIPIILSVLGMVFKGLGELAIRG